MTRQFGAMAFTTAALALVTPAAAHDAPAGWTYDVICCSNQDCKPISAKEVEATPAGWRVKTTGEVVAYPTTRTSRDGDFHRCSVGGRADGKTICLYVPEIGF